MPAWQPVRRIIPLAGSKRGLEFSFTRDLSENRLPLFGIML
jgi:hypothetical protein